MRSRTLAGALGVALVGGLAAAPFTAVETVAAGDGPNASAIALGGKMLVVANSDSQDVSRIDLATLEPMAPVPAGEVPSSLVLSADERTAYVGCFRGNSLAVIDLTAGRRVKSIPLGVWPRDVARVGGHLLASGYYSGKLVAVDLATLEVSGELELSPGLHAIRVHPGTGHAYVLNTSRDALYEVEVVGGVPRLVAQLGAEFGYQGNWDMELSPDASRLVVTQWGGDRVAILSTAPLAIEAFVETGGDGPCALAFTPDGEHVVVAHSESDDAAVVNVRRAHLRKVLPVGPFPFSDVHVVAGGRYALVTADNARKLAVLDLEALETVDHVATGRIPHVITEGSDGRLFVSNVSGKSVTVVRPTGRRGELFAAWTRSW